jgi:steroid Delta-isomerase
MLKSSMSTLPERILTLFATFHIRREKAIADMEAIYADDIHFVDPLHDVVGKEAFVRINRALLANFEEVRFDDLEVVGDDPHFMIKWTCTLRPRFGPALVAPGVSEISTKNGLVLEHKDYWDVLSALAGSLPIAAQLYKTITARLFSGVRG